MRATPTRVEQSKAVLGWEVMAASTSAEEDGGTGFDGGVAVTGRRGLSGAADWFVSDSDGGFAATCGIGWCKARQQLSFLFLSISAMENEHGFLVSFGFGLNGWGLVMWGDEGFAMVVRGGTIPWLRATVLLVLIAG